jgi:lipopolysaccharide transport system permease protein
MTKSSLSPIAAFSSIWRHRELIAALAKRDVIGRYRGSVFGLLWSFFTPMLMLTVYTVVFSTIFDARWSGGTGSKSEFALLLFSGLIVFNIFSECITRAPSLIISNANYVKKVVFPLEILPIVLLISSLFSGVVSFVVWLAAYIIFFGAPQLTALYIPLILLPLIMLIVGVSWVMASLGVYLRDISQFTNVMTTVLMFLSPIFYPAASIPDGYKDVFFLNPMTPIIEQVRGALYFGASPDLSVVAAYAIASFFASWLGYIWFQMTRTGFADVL